MVPTVGNGEHSTSTKAEQQCSVPLPTASAEAPVFTNVKGGEQNSVPHIITASGVKYAVSEKASIKDDHRSTEDQEVCILLHFIVCIMYILHTYNIYIYIYIYSIYIYIYI